MHTIISLTALNIDAGRQPHTEEHQWICETNREQSVSSMATARQVFFPDVVNLICEQCEPSTLAALARVRRDFTEPALNVLWYSIPDLGPLIRCMPQDLWVEEAFEYEIPRLMFCRSILPADWDRFKLHATRVRKFGFFDLLIARHDLGLDVYGSLACASIGRQPLLPQLTHINWNAADDEFPYISLFLSPLIIHLGFDLLSYRPRNSDEHASIALRLSLLPSLVSACPNIVHLGLSGCGMSEEVTWQEVKSAFSVMEQWSSLHHLEMEDILDNSILCVARLPALHTLVIKWQERETDELLAADVKGFPVLENLSVGSSKIEFCIMLFRSMSKTPLRSLRMGLWRVTRADRWSKLFDAIHQGITHDSLRTISINCDGFEVGHEESLSITSGELLPLLAFTRLTELSIELFGQFKLDNKDLQTMASAWPLLQTLKLVSLEKPSEYWPQITIEGLVSVVELCPLLENVIVAFDATNVPDFTEKLVRNERIRTLNILYSPIGSPARVAAFLSGVFPNLRSIDLYSGQMAFPWDNSGELDKWKEAESLTALFLSVRREEKLRYTST